MFPIKDYHVIGQIIPANKYTVEVSGHVIGLGYLPFESPTKRATSAKYSVYESFRTIVPLPLAWII
jgi:hypothetical protein